MHHIYGDSTPSLTDQMAECEDPFLDALFEKSSMPAGKNAGRKQTMANAKKQEYTDKEKRAYYIGLGSTMSHSQKGREKHVRALTGNNPAQIASYKRGRAEGQKRKQDYLGKQRAARSGKKK